MTLTELINTLSDNVYITIRQRDCFPFTGLVRYWNRSVVDGIVSNVYIINDNHIRIVLYDE